MDDTTKLLLRLVRSVLTAAPAEDLENPDQQTLEDLYKLAKKHDLAHLAAEGLMRAGALPTGELGAKFRKQKRGAIYSDETKSLALAQLGTALTEAKIAYIPLKGSVLRNYYPETWMRSRCDIDVLVHREQHGAACEALEASGFQIGRQWLHDVSLYSPSGVHLELHHALFTQSDYVKVSYLEDIWERARPAEPGSFCYVLEDAMFYCYHVSHMAKHMHSCGCGLRPFLDLWILNHQEHADHAGRTAMLKSLGLDTFAATASSLADSWFDETAALTPLAQQLEDFIVSCGIFGNLTVHTSNWRITPNQMLLQRIFKPYRDMVLEYPSLEKHPWLYPLYHLIRWRDIMRRSGFLDRIRYWDHQRKIYEKNNSEMSRFMEQLGLEQ